jgi:hypothetical protein
VADELRVTATTLRVGKSRGTLIAKLLSDIANIAIAALMFGPFVSARSRIRCAWISGMPGCCRHGFSSNERGSLMTLDPEVSFLLVLSGAALCGAILVTLDWIGRRQERRLKKRLVQAQSMDRKQSTV